MSSPNLAKAQETCMAMDHRLLRTFFVATALFVQASGLHAERSLEEIRGSSELPAIQFSAALDSEPIYQRLYDAGRAPQQAEIQGDWRGAALIFARQKPLPSLPILNLLIEAVSLKLWEGKTFLNAGGANRFLGGRLKMFRFTTENRPSRTGSGEALALDYGSNPYPVSAVRDEVRLIADGRLLGRAYLHAPDGKDYFLFYFMLAKTEVR
jgi:hypothetical protein